MIVVFAHFCCRIWVIQFTDRIHSLNPSLINAARAQQAKAFINKAGKICGLWYRLGAQVINNEDFSAWMS
jgi:(p)ppGpp synthase/HD superfamily hydrolase